MKEGSIIVTLYSKNDCQQCIATERKLKASNVEYVKLNTDESEEAADAARSYGYLQAPVVVAGDDHWSGFRPDKIDGLAATS